MRRLYILRHAEAMPSPEDRTRPLSTRGRHDAEVLGQKMKSQKMFPDYVVCSPARRTRETYAVLESFLPETSCIYPEYLYNATLEDLVHGMRGLTASVNAALFIGHNPGIHMLARALAQEGDVNARNSLSFGFKPCTMAVILSNAEDWADLAPGNCKIGALLSP